MGYPEDISGTSYKSRSWSVPHLMSYMESHDEERLAYKNKQFGNSAGTYNVKDPATSLERIKAASVIFYSVPGPKMLWQFGELGYDYSINTCADGSVSNDCRVSPKPVKWEYLNEGPRAGLFLHTADLIKLHNSYTVFKEGDATISSGTSLMKQVQVKSNPYNESPTSTNDMNVQAVANLDIVAQQASVNFPHTGTWYDYYNGGEPISVSALPYPLTLQPGEYRLFTDVEIGAGPVTAIETPLQSHHFTPYPNPTSGKFAVDAEGLKAMRLYDVRGAEWSFTREGNLIDISNVPDGLYILQHQDKYGRRSTVKIIKK
jgi:hypothetical protein